MSFAVVGAPFAAGVSVRELEFAMLRRVEMSSDGGFNARAIFENASF